MRPTSHFPTRTASRHSFPRCGVDESFSISTPEADTPGCTTQACGVRDRAADYQTVDAIVLGVSPDPPDKLRAFADRYRLQFTLLGDEDHAVAERYGVSVKRLIPRRGYTGMERSTFLIGRDGRIEQVFRKVDPATHGELVLGALVA